MVQDFDQVWERNFGNGDFSGNHGFHMECSFEFSFDKEFLFGNGGTLLFRAGTLYFIGYKDLKREILMVERNYLLLYERTN